MDKDFLFIRQMKKGEKRGFEAFIEKYYPKILSYCIYHSQNPEDAKDLTQETFARFFQHFSQYRHMGKAGNYLYTIAGNLCRDYYGRKKELLMPSPPDFGEDKREREYNKLFVEWMLDKLPEDLREIVIFHYFLDLTYREIAGVLKIGEPLVKYRMKRAKMLLKTMCEDSEK